MVSEKVSPQSKWLSSSKGKELARRVEFLTTHVPNLRVIMVGESNGTAIIDSAMNFLRDNPRVYSIRTGTPLWHEPVALDRTLLLNTNGLVSDAFSDGNIPLMFWVTLKDRLGLSSPGDAPGTVLTIFRAPGHHYTWQYPHVYYSVVSFLEENFGVKQG